MFRLSWDFKFSGGTYWLSSEMSFGTCCLILNEVIPIVRRLTISNMVKSSQVKNLSRSCGSYTSIAFFRKLVLASVVLEPELVLSAVAV